MRVLLLCIAGSRGGYVGEEKKEGEHVQLEECVGDLQHQNVWVVVFMADQDPFARSPHAMLFVMLLQPLQARDHRGVFFGLVFLRAEGVVAEGVEADRFGLVGGKGFGQHRSRHCSRSV